MALASELFPHPDSQDDHSAVGGQFKIHAVHCRTAPWWS
jgi:hypothetical protein